MPELPDVVVYIECLQRRIVGRPLEKVRLRSPFLVRTFEPPLSALEGKRVRGLRRLAKRIVWELEGELFMVFRLFSGIGNAFSDEILHAARMSPLQWTSRLSDEQIERLHASSVDVLDTWTRKLREEAGDGFPEKVTAFKEGMAVHGRFKQPCPRCGALVQRIVYADNETNYCAPCQTGGKVLADRLLSQLLKDDWPRSIEEWEDRLGR